jgi:acetyl-CoA acetyltransferase
MTNGFGAKAAPDISDEVLEIKDAEDCLLPMGITSENVANDYNISRQAQDEFAGKSFQKAAAASKAGKFKAEIIPITAKFIDPKTEKVLEIVVDQDDGIRDGVTVESLAKLKPAFTKDGSTHAGKLFAFSFLPSFLIKDQPSQETRHKYQTAPLLFSLPVVPSQNASVSLSLVNTSQQLPSVSPHESWVSALHMPSLASSN